MDKGTLFEGPIGNKRKINRLFAPVLLMAAGFLLTGLLFWWTRADAIHDLKESFQLYAAERFGLIKDELDSSVSHVDALQLYYHLSGKVSRKDFRHFVEPWLKDKSLQAIEWIPRVPSTQKSTYENTARRDGITGFLITEKNDRGQLIPVSSRREYFPVYYVEPLKGNEAAVGFDLASNPERLAALEKARDTGIQTATERITLVQEKGNQFGFLVFAPVYEQGTSAKTREQRRAHLKGFVLGVFRAGDLTKTAIAKTATKGLETQLIGLTASPERQLLCAYHPRISPGKKESTTAPRNGLNFVKEFSFADRTWQIAIQPTQTFLDLYGRSWYWFILPLGFLITFFTSFSLNILYKQKEQVESALRIRTKELKENEEAAKRLSQENMTIAQIGRIIGSSLDIEEVYESFAQEVKKLIPFDGLAINIINHGELTVSVPFVFGLDVAGCQKGEVFPLVGSATQEVMQSRSSLNIQIESLEGLPTKFPFLFQGFKQGIRSLIVSPLISKDTVIGALHIRSLTSQAYSQQDLELAEKIGFQIAGTIANAQLFKELKNKEAALKKSEKQYRLLAENVSDVIWIRDMNLKCTYVSPSIEKMTGYTVEEAMNLTTEETYIPESLANAQRVLNEELTLKENRCSDPFRVRTLEFEAFRKDGSKIWTESSMTFLRDSTGQIYGIQGVSRDITDRKRAEEQVLASLKEKETLLKEIHHRVKNNLAVISSLLGLQSRYLEDEKSREIFQESQDRVRVMANIHTLLYQSEDLSRVDFGGFIRDLAGRLQQSYGTAEFPIEIHVDIADVSLPIETSISCGLVLNELVSNALKHAFPEGRGGEVNISMITAEDRYVLNVQDNGIGFPEAVAFQNTKSLGLELVNLLVGQINGTIDLTVDGGTKFTITFPMANNKG
ncbi:MAG: CHASE domain-containing protein [Pseudomonadota bacterium]